MKIIYLKQEVNIGNIINFQGLKLTLTQEIVNNNPDLFEIKKEPLFTTEDGVDIYEGSIVYRLQWTDSIPDYREIRVGKNLDLGWKYVSTKKAAKNWVEANKPKEKTLEDYEHSLLNKKGKVLGYTLISGATMYSRDLYYYLKQYEPKLYWLKVLQLIADDLNGDWKRAKVRDSEAWFIGRQYESNLDDYNSIGAKKHSTVDYGLVYFKDRESCNKAISLLGKDIKYIL